jgi:putative membrane protein
MLAHSSWLVEWYIWIKVTHLVALVFWMLGMLGLPLLYLGHRRLEPDSSAASALGAIEARLARTVMTPAMIVVLLTGTGMLIAHSGLLSGAGFMHVKLLLVVLLCALHGVLLMWRRRLAQQRGGPGRGVICVAGGAVVLLLVGIMILIEARPF